MFKTIKQKKTPTTTLTIGVKAKDGQTKGGVRRRTRQREVPGPCRPEPLLPLLTKSRGSRQRREGDLSSHPESPEFDPRHTPDRG